MQLRSALVIAGVLATVGISACGSSKKSTSATTAPAQTPTNPTASIPSPSPVTSLDPAFIARANAVCARAKRVLDAHGQFPYPNFNPLQPEVKLLPKVGAFFAATQSVSDRVPIELRDLGTPRKAQLLWGQMVALAKEDRVIADRQIKAAEASNATAFVATVNAVASTHSQIGQDAVVGGFSNSSPCNAIF